MAAFSPTSPPTALSNSAPLEPHQFSSIIHSIQRRAVDRASSHDHGPSATGWRDLQDDLALSARLGGALLEDKSALEKRLLTTESANQKLLDRLTASVKEATQLQRRLEETVSNLEQAESNNRSLLVSLEESRKTVSRLSHDSGKLVAASSQLKNITQAHDDLKQELVAERKRASTAEARAKKQVERVGDMEERLRKANEDLAEMRQDKVLRSRKSHDALAKVKAKYGSGSANFQSDPSTLAGNPEATELLKIVESLVTENDMLRSESMELHELLDVSRDEQLGLRSEMAHREVLAEEDEEDIEHETYAHSRRSSGIVGAHTLLAEVLSSPSLVQTGSNYFSDFDGHHPYSPASTVATSYNRSYNQSSSLSHSQRGANLSRTLSCGSASGGEEPSRHAHFQHGVVNDGRRAHRRRSSGIPATISAAMPPRPPSSSAGQVPFGRGHNRRSASVDVSSIRTTDLDSSRLNAGSAPGTPYPDSSAHQHASSVYSITSENEEPLIRPKRHHRPLSLSLGPSLFPQVPEDEATYGHQAASSTQRRASQPSTLPPSTSGEASLGSAPSGLSFDSPDRPKRTRRATADDNPTLTVDTSTQTSPFSPGRRASPRPSSSTPLRSSSMRSHSPQPDLSRSNTSLSELSDGDKYLDPTFPLAGPHDARTAVLAKLIEHAAKLLARIQAADIASQEKRLKKQNLSGDVRHLAQANLKDVMADVENLRHNFRRVLEQERVEMTKEIGGDLHTTESLVLRRDFVALVKLFRDLLFETTRLRSLVNRVQLEPHLATNLRDLDGPDGFDGLVTAPKTSNTSGGGGLLAPLSRLLTAALSGESTEPTPPRVPSPVALRPPPKRSGSSAVSSTEVSVKFGAGAARRAVANEALASEGSPGASSDGRAKASPQAISVGRKTGSQVKRDLNSIFAGAASSSYRPSVPDRWVNVARPSASSNPFGRLLASYRPAPSSTTNAVLDSLPHAPASRQHQDMDAQPSLLERQLRPRGLSDSSIRSTFVAHANPHHRMITPATLALSGEATAAAAVPILVQGDDLDADDDNIPVASSSTANSHHGLKHQLSSSLLSASTLNRRPSTSNLKSKKSVAQLRAVSGPSSHSQKVAPPMPSPRSASVAAAASSSPPVPVSISISPSGAASQDGLASAAQSLAPQSLFGNLTTWASKAAGLSSPIAAAAASDEQDNRIATVKSTDGVAGGRDANVQKVGAQPNAFERSGRPGLA